MYCRMLPPSTSSPSPGLRILQRVSLQARDFTLESPLPPSAFEQNEMSRSMNPVQRFVTSTRRSKPSLLTLHCFPGLLGLESGQAQSRDPPVFMRWFPRSGLSTIVFVLPVLTNVLWPGPLAWDAKRQSSDEFKPKPNSFRGLYGKASRSDRPLER